jgi:hypothetical protein
MTSFTPINLVQSLGRLSFSKSRQGRARTRRCQSNEPAMVELLETRKVLSPVAMVAVSPTGHQIVDNGPSNQNPQASDLQVTKKTDIASTSFFKN